MSDELTTQPMLEALLEGVRQVSSELSELRGVVGSISERLDALAAKQDALAISQAALAAKQDALAVSQAALAAKQDALAENQAALAAKVDELAARQERLEVKLAGLSIEVHDGFFDHNRRAEILNNRLLDFEIALKKVDERLHDEILVRTR